MCAECAVCESNCTGLKELCVVLILGSSKFVFYVYVYIYIYICVYIYVYIYMYTYIHVRVVSILSYLRLKLLLETPKTFTMFESYDRMTVHRNRFFVNKSNKCTEFQFYWYYASTCFGQPFRPSSGVLSRTLALVHFMQL
jgi:hypothetical protein